MQNIQSWLKQHLSVTFQYEATSYFILINLSFKPIRKIMSGSLFSMTNNKITPFYCSVTESMCPCCMHAQSQRQPGN